MRRLVESWIEAEKEYHGLTLGEAIERLNEDLGMRINYSRVAEWKRGRYVPNPTALSWILSRTLPWVVQKMGLDPAPEALDRMAELLWVREIKNGKRIRYWL